MADAARDAFLRLCADPEGDHDAALAALGGREWTRLVDMAEGGRSAPLLARAAPTRIATGGDCAASRRLCLLDRAARIDALQERSALVRICVRLASVGIEPIALKGTAIAALCYPERYLRPMVDIDLLIPGEGARRARDVLLTDDAFAVHPDFEDQVWRNEEHLVPLVDRATRTTFELHWRIGAAIGGGELQRIVEETAVAQDFGAARALLAAPHANVLHLVANAATKDRFVSQMRVLVDLAYAFGSEAIEPDAILRDFDRLCLARGFAVLAALAREGGARWPDMFSGGLEPVPDSVIGTAYRLMMVPRALATRDRMVGRGSLPGRSRLSSLVARIGNPDPRALESFGADGGRGRIRAYLRWIASRTGEGIRALIARRRYNIGDSERLVAWLQPIREDR